MERYDAKTTPDRLIKRLQKSCLPWNRAAFYKGGAYLLSVRGRKFTLTINGARARTRPQRVFRGEVRKNGPHGSVITGRFGMMTRDRLLVYLPAQALVLLAVFLTPRLDAKFSAVLWVAVLLCSAVLIGFMTVMDRILGAERQQEMADFLKQIGEKPQ